MASLFVIREKNTGSYCTSSKFNYFGSDLQKASLFNQRKNAEKVARNMFAKADKGELNRFGGWYWRVDNGKGDINHFHHALLKEYIEMLKNEGTSNLDNVINWLEANVSEQRCEMEVVEIKLSLV